MGVAGAAAPEALAGGGRGEIEAACKAHGYAAGSACPCIADRAMQQMNEAQRAWLVASITRNQAESARLQGTMTVVEIVAVGTFMTLAPQQCSQ
jgi:hypothetical protein